MINKPEKSSSLRIWLPTIRAGSGTDVFAQRLANALRGAGHAPLLQWFDHRYELIPWRLRHVVAPPDIDVVHAGSWQGFAFKRVGVPLVVTEHLYAAHPAFSPYRSRSQAAYHRLFAERCAKRSYAEADAIVTVSEFCASAMRMDLGESVEVIHNWVDTTLFSPSECRARDNSLDKIIRLLFVGNPSRWKGADILPDLAVMLGSGFEICCLGGLRKGFGQTALPPNMTLLPRVGPESMPEIYRTVDIVLVPTRYEAFGYVALEAMASGLPVVGFNAAGTAEVCVDGETALLAPVDDVERLATCIRKLAANTNLRARLGLAGRQRAIECFGEAKAISAYVDVYRRAMRKSAGLANEGRV